jgi:hypothetical protein
MLIQRTSTTSPIPRIEEIIDEIELINKKIKLIVFHSGYPYKSMFYLIPYMMHVRVQKLIDLIPFLFEESILRRIDSLEMNEAEMKSQFHLLQTTHGRRMKYIYNNRDKVSQELLSEYHDYKTELKIMKNVINTCRDEIKKLRSIGIDRAILDQEIYIRYSDILPIII